MHISVSLRRMESLNRIHGVTIGSSFGVSGHVNPHGVAMSNSMNALVNSHGNLSSHRMNGFDPVDEGRNRRGEGTLPVAAPGNTAEDRLTHSVDDRLTQNSLKGPKVGLVGSGGGIPPIQFGSFAPYMVQNVIEVLQAKSPDFQQLSLQIVAARSLHGDGMVDEDGIFREGLKSAAHDDPVFREESAAHGDRPFIVNSSGHSDAADDSSVVIEVVNQSEPANDTQTEPANDTQTEPTNDSQTEPTNDTQTELANDTQTEPAIENPLEPAIENHSEPAAVSQLDSAIVCQSEPAIVSQSDPAIVRELGPAIVSQLEYAVANQSEFVLAPSLRGQDDGGVSIEDASPISSSGSSNPDPNKGIAPPSLVVDELAFPASESSRVLESTSSSVSIENVSPNSSSGLSNPDSLQGISPPSLVVDDFAFPPLISRRGLESTSSSVSVGNVSPISSSGLSNPDHIQGAASSSTVVDGNVGDNDIATLESQRVLESTLSSITIGNSSPICSPGLPNRNPIQGDVSSSLVLDDKAFPPLESAMAVENSFSVGMSHSEPIKTDKAYSTSEAHRGLESAPSTGLSHSTPIKSVESNVKSAASNVIESNVKVFDDDDFPTLGASVSVPAGRKSKKGPLPGKSAESPKFVEPSSSGRGRGAQVIHTNLSERGRREYHNRGGGRASAPAHQTAEKYLAPGDDKTIENLGRTLTKILRHKAPELNLAMGDDGYASVDAILKLSLKTFSDRPLSSHTVDDVLKAVETDNKQRFGVKYVDGKILIRANQGHSIERVESEKLLTPILSAENIPVCVHGTYFRHVESIAREGLKKMSRNHVHFATGKFDSKSVLSGMRKNSEVLVYLNLKKALDDGMKFYISENGVILTDGFEGVVPPKYFLEMLQLPDMKPLSLLGSASTSIPL